LFTKTENTEDLLNDIEINQFIKFYFGLNHLKHIYRKGWLLRGIPKDLCESVAEHSYGVAVLAMIIGSKNYDGLNLKKLIEMALIHDVGEIYIGDVTPDDGINPIDKLKNEREAIEKTFSKLDSGGKYIELWDEFQRNKSLEAHLIHQIDKLEMALQASVYKQMGYSDLGEFFSSVENQLNDPVIRELFLELRKI
jgi:putative hydrolases of HD superfamily